MNTLLRSGALGMSTILFLLAGCVPRTEVLRQSCEAGNAQDCSSLGDIYLTGRNGVVKDSARAVSLFQLACDGGEPRGCYELARANAWTGVPDNEERATTLFRNLCVRGFGGGCHGLGEMYVAGVGVPKDEARARALFQQACESDFVIRIANGQAARKDAAFISTCVADFMKGAQSRHPGRANPAASL